MTKARRGIYAAAVSPLDDAGVLDAPKLAQYCRYLLDEGGCDGVAPTGTTGEGTSLSVDERMALPAAFDRAGIAPDQVIFGTGSSAVSEATRLTANAVSSGYANVLVLPPFYYKNVSDAGLYEYYSRIVEGVGDDGLRLYLYHFPQMSAAPLSVNLVLRLRGSFGPIIAGLKDSSGDFQNARAFASATGGIDADFDVYPSSEAMLFNAKSEGCAGIISGTTNAFAQLVQEALAEDDPKSPAFERVQEARAFASQFNLMAAMKYAEFLRTGDESWLRMAPPLSPLTADQQSRFAQGWRAILRREEAAVE